MGECTSVFIQKFVKLKPAYRGFHILSLSSRNDKQVKFFSTRLYMILYWSLFHQELTAVQKSKKKKKKTQLHWESVCLLFIPGNATISKNHFSFSGNSPHPPPMPLQQGIASASHQGLGSRWTLPLLYIENFQLSSTHLVTSVKFEHTCLPSLLKKFKSASVRKKKKSLGSQCPAAATEQFKIIYHACKKIVTFREYDTCAANSGILSFQ